MNSLLSCCKWAKIHPIMTGPPKYKANRKNCLLIALEIMWFSALGLSFGAEGLLLGLHCECDHYVEGSVRMSVLTWRGINCTSVHQLWLSALRATCECRVDPNPSVMESWKGGWTRMLSFIYWMQMGVLCASLSLWDSKRKQSAGTYTQ